MKKIFYFLVILLLGFFLKPAVIHASTVPCICTDEVTKKIKSSKLSYSTWEQYFLDCQKFTKDQCHLYNCKCGTQMVVTDANNDINTLDAMCKISCDSLGGEEKKRYEDALADKKKAIEATTAGTALTGTAPTCTVVDRKSTGIWASIPYCHQCGTCELSDFIIIGIEISKYILGLVGSLAFLMFVYGGFMMLISAGSPERVKTGQKILVNAVIGLIIVLTSWLIINFAYRLLGVNFTGTFDSRSPLPEVYTPPSS